MEEEKVYEAAKTATYMVLGIIFSLAFLIVLSYFDVIEFNLGIDPVILTMFIALLLSMGIWPISSTVLTGYNF